MYTLTCMSWIRECNAAVQAEVPPARAHLRESASQSCRTLDLLREAVANNRRCLSTSASHVRHMHAGTNPTFSPRTRRQLPSDPSCLRLLRETESCSDLCAGITKCGGANAHEPLRQQAMHSYLAYLPGRCACAAFQLPPTGECSSSAGTIGSGLAQSHEAMTPRAPLAAKGLHLQSSVISIINAAQR
jgi:hypothetical protein